MKRVLIVAGSDSGGGAGIQADLKTVSAFGVWGTTAVTALTAQNTRTVADIHAVPPAFVGAQIRAVLDDIGADAVKVGMLADAAIVAEVARALDPAVPIVLDPVMVAKGGARLLLEGAVRALAEGLLPRAALVTPNIPEAEILSGIRVQAVESMVEAGRTIVGRGARAVLVKGGHLAGDTVVDVVIEGGRVRRFEHARVATRNTHGTGCTLSSAIAALLALGRSLPDAVGEARSFVRLAMLAGPAIGGGHGPLDHLVILKREAERFAIIEALRAAFAALRAMGFASLVPEVQSNFAYAIPWAESPADVAAFPGRIVRVGGDIAAPADPAFGASRHVARIVLTVMRYDPEYRACLNIRHGADVLDRLRAAGLTVASFDRRDEPAAVKAREGSSLEWGTDSVLRRSKGIPDAVADGGDVGKEPMVRILGRSPGAVVEKVRPLLARF